MVSPKGWLREDWGFGGTQMSYSCPVLTAVPRSSSLLDELYSLELGDVLGQGGGGTVFRSRMGTLDVAVKVGGRVSLLTRLRKMPSALHEPTSAEAHLFK